MGHRRDRADGRKGRRKGRRQGVQGAPAFFYILYFFTHLFYHTYSSPSTRTRKTRALLRVFRVLWLRSPPFHPNTKNATMWSRSSCLGCFPHPRHENATPVLRSSCLGCPSTLSSTLHHPDTKNATVWSRFRVWGPSLHPLPSRHEERDRLVAFFVSGMFPTPQT